MRYGKKGWREEKETGRGREDKRERGEKQAKRKNRKISLLALGSPGISDLKVG